MVGSLRGRSGVNVRSHVDGDISHVIVIVVPPSHHVVEKIVLHLVIPMNYKLV